MIVLHPGDDLDVVTAYHSENDFKSDFPKEAKRTHEISKAGTLLGQMIVVPEEGRRKSYKMQLNCLRLRFPRLRRKLYEKQKEMIKEGRTNEQVLDKLNELD